MGIASSASASSPPPEPAAPADPPLPKLRTQPSSAAASPTPEASAPADPSPKADAPAPGGDAGEEGETVVLDASPEAGDQEGQEEGECGFCLFMKGGGCKEEFVGWEKCVEEAEVAGGDDVVERCYEATAALRKCMDAHAEYYEPILRAERAMAEDLEAAMASEASEPSPTSPAAAAAEQEQQGGSKKQAEEEVVAKEKQDHAV